MEIKTKIKNWDYSDYVKHLFTIKNLETGMTATVEGDWIGGGGSYDDVKATYKFKTNDSGVREIEMRYNNNDDVATYKVAAMLRNKPIQKCEVLKHIVTDRYTPEEMTHRNKMKSIHEILKNRGVKEYMYYENPILLKRDTGDTVSISYITSDWFGFDDIINYKTDHICLSELSDKELAYLENNI